MSSVIIDKIGRRILLITSFIGGGVCLSAVGVYFYYQEVIGIEHEENSLLRYVTFIGIVTFNVCATLGFDTLTYLVPGEIFPMNVKSIAMTALSVFSAALTFSTVKGYQLVKDLSGLYGVFWFFSTFSYLGAIFTYYVIPETKGKSLRQIQIDLQGDMYDEANVNPIQDSKNNFINNDDEVKELNEKLVNGENK